ncbi:hypothetical protein [Arthrobacter sp. SX1312]|uniref:hypothetical protein n=1 Tax=Arthrobacter sp. SX1312 TaxID=2058896 RepID=UPI000CE2BBBF|nr:hypothetical protein [Arthrobacter sp. SX1312]
MPIDAENYEEVMDTLQSLANDGVGAVKPTVEHILAQIDGEEFSNGEDTAVIEDFKDFCKDYTVG